MTNYLSIPRQHNRYRPHVGEDYFELNAELTKELQSLSQELSGLRGLDIGAGEIPFKSFYNESGVFVETCDVSQNSDNTIDYLLDGGSKLPFNDGSYDVIFLFDVLEHIKSDVEFIEECFRVLRNGGQLIATVPFMYRFHEQPNDFRRYTPSGLRYLLESQSNFRLVKLVPIGSLFFTIYHLLAENDLKFGFLRRSIIRILIWLTSLLSLPSDLSESAPFSFYFVAKKPTP